MYEQSVAITAPNIFNLKKYRKIVLKIIFKISKIKTLINGTSGRPIEFFAAL